MNRDSNKRGLRPANRRALSLVEVSVSTVIVGGMLVASLTTVAHSLRSLQRTGDRAKGMLLAQQLMTEILQRPYEEPDDAIAFGRELLELSTARGAYDDVDDYDNWSASPPQYKDGTAIPDLTGWRRSVTVLRANPGNLLTSSGSDTGVKTITVTVSRKDVPAAELTAVRTGAGSTALINLDRLMPTP